MKNFLYLRKNISIQKIYLDKLNRLIGSSRESGACYVFGKFGIMKGELYVKYPKHRIPETGRKRSVASPSNLVGTPVKKHEPSNLSCPSAPIKNGRYKRPKDFSPPEFPDFSKEVMSVERALIVLNSLVSQSESYTDTSVSTCPGAPLRPGARSKVTAETIRKLESYKKRLSFLETMEHLKNRGRLEDITNKDADFLSNRRKTIKRVRFAGIENDPSFHQVVSAAINSVPDGAFSELTNEQFKKRYLTDTRHSTGSRRSGSLNRDSRSSYTSRQALASASRVGNLSKSYKFRSRTKTNLGSLGSSNPFSVRSSGASSLLKSTFLNSRPSSKPTSKISGFR